MIKQTITSLTLSSVLTIGTVDMFIYGLFNVEFELKIFGVLLFFVLLPNAALLKLKLKNTLLIANTFSFIIMALVVSIQSLSSERENAYWIAMKSELDIIRQDIQEKCKRNKLVEIDLRDIKSFDVYNRGENISIKKTSLNTINIYSFGPDRDDDHGLIRVEEELFYSSILSHPWSSMFSGKLIYRLSNFQTNLNGDIVRTVECI
jgi:predicted membrane protein